MTRAEARVAKMTAHPRFTAEGRPFDVGLAQLVTPAPVAPLPLSDEVVTASLVGRQARHVGYGSDQELPMSGWGTRRSVTHALLSFDDDFVWSGDARANTCTGDSGGPLLLDGAVLGVVSDGPDCHSPSADQRLDRVRAWVETQRDAMEPPPAPAHGCTTTPDAGGLLCLAVILARRTWRRR